MTSRIPGKQLGMSPDGWVKVSSSIASSTTIVVDTIALADMQCIEYILALWNVANDKRKMMNINVTKNTGSLKEAVYGKIGNNLSVTVDLAISGPNMELSMTNSELFTVQVQLARIIFK